MATPLLTTTDYNCYFQSRTSSTAELNNTNEIVETWIIEKKNNPVVGVSPIADPETDQYQDMVTQGAIPFIGQEYYAWNVNSTLGWSAVMRCRSHEFTTLSNGRVQVIIRFSSMYQVDPSTWGTASIEYHLPVSVEYVAKTRDILLFRRDWTSPPLATLDQSPSDIGGTASILGSVEGVPAVVPQVGVRLRVVHDATDAEMSGVALVFALMIGTRNETIFLGFPIQSLVFEGFNIAKLEGEFYEIVFDFVFDRYYEHSQVPQTDPDGEPTLNNTGTELADVRWQRIHRDTAEFNECFFRNYTELLAGTIFTAQRDIAEKGYWV